VLGAWLTTGLALVTVAAAIGTPIVDQLFEGEIGLITCLVIALFTYCVQHITRGTLAGNGRFGPYGMILGAEGLIRIVPCVALAVAGVDDPVYYGLCLAIPPVFASLVSLRGQHGLVEPGPEAPWSELSTNLGWLFLGSVLAQALSYAPFLGAQILAKPGQRDAVADFIVGLFLARIPILLFQAVQAALLPKLAHLIGSGRHDDFREGLRKLVFVVVGIGVIGVIGGATIGPAVGEVLFGEKFTLGNVDLALLAAGSGLFILALTLAQALIALMGHAKAVVAWAAGIVLFVAVTAATGPDLFRRVELGFIAGAAAAAGVMALMLMLQLRSGIPEGSLESLVEQIEHEPLEI
jgi:O-antigen/teichoic acid export membrane protein